jgi:glycosyl transferase family 25
LISVFVISLPEAEDRRAFVRGQLEAVGLGFEFVDAVRGSDRYDDPRSFDLEKCMRIELRKMTPGEVGCALSHQKVYDLIAARGLPHALVMEDDAVVSPDLPAVLEALEERIRPNDLIQLERCDVYSRKAAERLAGPYMLVKPKMVKYGSMSQAAGYVIGRKAAASIRSVNRPVYVPADSWGQYLGQVDFRGVIPTLTLIRQDVSFECTTQDYQRSEFTPSTRFGLLRYAFKTRSSLGRFLVRTAKRMLGRA